MCVGVYVWCTIFVYVCCEFGYVICMCLGV